MAPIRVGLIGLSGAPLDEYEGVSWAPNAHLPYLKASPNHEIVALLNSSAESGRQAVIRYNLPPNTKTYEKPEDLAADPDVDLVVCSVRVDRHMLTVKPSIIAGKAVYVEWPLEKNLEIAKEVADLGRKHNVKSIVGIQGAFAPIAQKLKAAIGSGRIGKVLSSTITASSGSSSDTEVKGVRYFTDRKIGGNPVSIHLGHAFEWIAAALGEFKCSDSLLSNRHPTKNIIDPAKDNQIVYKDVPNNVPDQIMMQGIVSPLNVPVSIHYRVGQPFPGTPQLDWRVQGDLGELRITMSTFFLMLGSPDEKLEYYNKQTGEIEILEPEKDEWDELPIPARNIARLYEAFRKDEWHPDFDWAVKRHEMLDEIWRKYDKDSGDSLL
ncbi:putative dehydrogenase [Amylocarpus encephaloides]|uniref:Dehydrogenase n=1 Tax=Amylocarpus encephaloides TaxID=45428 RepID=A0A9P8CBF1_9HELO|nr:putative dehydrogenase [Amylocarpus encephaloides]